MQTYCSTREEKGMERVNAWCFPVILVESYLFLLRAGQLIVAKVFVGKVVPAKNGNK